MVVLVRDDMFLCSLYDLLITITTKLRHPLLTGKTKKLRWIDADVADCWNLI